MSLSKVAKPGSSKDTNKGDSLNGSVLPSESIKALAESLGINALSDDVANNLAADVTSKIKLIIESSVKFMRHSRRNTLLSTDIDSALKYNNIEPQSGFQSKDSEPFGFSSGGGREFETGENIEVEPDGAASNANVTMPPDVKLRKHWLAIDGEQPQIPENPPQMSKKDQEAEALNPVVSLDLTVPPRMMDRPRVTGRPKLRTSEIVAVKELAVHELSAEQQIFFLELTQACIGIDEPQRSKALQSLSEDHGLIEMLPQICTFISEGVKVNVVLTDLSMLIYLMRMVKALLDNENFYIQKCLHELIPAVTTCIVSRQLCMRPEVDNHWALRDFSARLIAFICNKFNNTTNNLQTRMIRVFCKSFQNDRVFLTSMYGSIIGLCQLGQEVIQAVILPNLKLVSDCVEGKLYVVTSNDLDEDAAERIRNVVLNFCVPILLQTRSPPDFFEEFKTEFGTFLGPSLFFGVMKGRIAHHSSQPAQTTSLGAIPKNR